MIQLSMFDAPGPAIPDPRWDAPVREWLAMPIEMDVLRRYAEQPGNIRSRKPARLIYLYTLGWSVADIEADLRLSSDTLQKYFMRWIEYGVQGVTGSDELGRCY